MNRAIILAGCMCLAAALVTRTAAQPSPLPPRLIVGYWHNFANAAGALRLADVPAAYDVVDVAFAVPATGAAMAFVPYPQLYGSNGQFATEVAQLQAKGKKVLISVGGANAMVRLNSANDVQDFVSSLALIITTFGFDGLDLDLESTSLVLSGTDTDFRSPTTPSITNLIHALNLLLAEFPGGIILSASPETALVQGGYGAYGGVYGAFLPVLHALRDKFTYIHVQDYNSGSMYGRDGVVYQPATADFLTAMADMLVSGFTVAAFSSRIPFPGLGADKVLLGLPATSNAASSGFLPFPDVRNALNEIYLGKPFGGSYHLSWPAGYSRFRGVMTWSVNWDVNAHLAWSSSYRQYLDTLVTSISEHAVEAGPGNGQLALEPNYPNPFNPATTLGFSLPRPGRVRLAVYDLLGRQVAILLDTQVAAGHLEVRFEAKGLSSGVYVCVLESGGGRAVRRMTLLR